MKKYILLMMACACVSVPGFAQRGKVVQAIVKPVKIPLSATMQQTMRTLQKGKVPSWKAIQRNYFKELNLAVSNSTELAAHLRKSGVLVRQISLPGVGFSHAFTMDGKNWYFSNEMAEIVQEGFFVRELPNGKIGFSIDRESPSFDFFNRELLLEMKRLKEEGFLFKTEGNHFGIAFPQTTASETPVYLVGKRGGSSSTESMPVKYIPGMEIVPHKIITEEQGPWSLYPTQIDQMLNKDEVLVAMKAYHSMYDGLKVAIEKLEAYKDSVSLVWRTDKYIWSVYSNGYLYNSVDEFLIEKEIHQ